MSLFQSTVVTKYLNAKDTSTFKERWHKFQNHFHNPEIQENIRNSKEEQYQGEFLIDLFVNVLGYTKNPHPDFNLTTEFKNVKDSKKADGAIIFNNEVKAVIELKGTETTDLSKVEAQAFGYKNNQPKCKYVIISNFEKVRLYIDNATEHLELNLFTLTEKDFGLLYLFLGKENVEKDIPQKIKNESLSKEGEITKQLYKDYSLFKRELHRNLVALNPQFDALTLFKKSQKLLDRFLFLFFAEDRLLLPPNSVRLVLSDWKELKERDVDVSLYERFKKYFGYLNTGFKGKRYDVFPYNGGLFEPDELLDEITIDDNLLYRHTLKISDYDFVSEVDVNILGHIFENSLTEIEEVEAELTGHHTERTKSKRKKDGVFYTPKYITKYIVENTVGRLCEEKKAVLDIKDENYQPAKQRSKKRLQNLQDYREWLLKITICDPACGSGAFLNQALDFLIDEHRYIDELSAKYNKDAFILSDVENSILENNLFGVDINEESIQIAKLSLWLRTAQKNRKLNDLNDNIKCGNSLIDEEEFAGSKAFKWEVEFKEVFSNGGFDIIIGNPPYVNLESVQETSKALAKSGYMTYNKRGDLYCVFVEKGFQLLKQNGFISFIMPNKWLQAGYGASLREYLLERNLIQLIDFGDFQIFEGATTYPCIFVAKNALATSTFSVSVLQSAKELDFVSNVSEFAEDFKSKDFGSDTWVISSLKEKALLERLTNNLETLSDFLNGEANYGIKFGLTEAFLIDDDVREKLIEKDSKSSEIIGSVLRGRDIKRYGVPSKKNLDNIILASYGSYKYLPEKYPAIYNHLLQYEEKLKKRGQCNGSKITQDKPYLGQHHWLELDNNPSKPYLDLYQKPKIMYQTFQVKPCFILDNQNLYCNNSMWIIPTDNKALLGVLNSKMGWWLITKYCTQIQNGCQLIWKYFGQIPLPNIENETLSLLVEKMLELTKVHQGLTDQFQRSINRNFEIEKLSRKLENWHELNFKDFVKELKKKKVVLSLNQQAEWEEYFLQEQQKAQAIKSDIDKLDAEIDTLVYSVYGLTEEEIKIIEVN